VLIGLTAGVHTVAVAQSGDYTITLSVFNCPEGMTAGSLVVDECAPATEGFDVRIISLSGIMPPLTLAEATLVDDRFEWGSVLINERGAVGPLAIEETELPDGYTDYWVEGSGVELNSLGDWTFPVSPENPNPELAIYNVAPNATEPTPQPAEPEESVLAASIETGMCEEAEGGSRVALEPPQLASGSREGSAAALPAATSYSVVEVAMGTLLERDHAVVVRDAGNDAILACGEIGGLRSFDGALAIGLRSQADSSVFGVAYLALLPDDSAQTQVSLFVAGSAGF
jgi:hypothetical protein